MHRPSLEIISRSPPPGVALRSPLLFVHGAFAAAWCWEEHFLDYFAERGHPSWAGSLRGHGSSEGHERLLWTRISEYVDDVSQAVALCGERPPVLIGHSMGGMVVQKYLEQGGAAAGLVLMASVPPSGLMPTAWALLLNDPLLYAEVQLMQVCGVYFARPDTARRALFAPGVPDDLVLRCMQRVTQESLAAVLDMSLTDLLRTPVPGPWPTCVLGGELDRLVPKALVESTASQYGVEPVIFPGVAHAMMLDLHWRAVADWLHAWLVRQGL